MSYRSVPAKRKETIVPPIVGLERGVKEAMAICDVHPNPARPIFVQLHDLTFTS